MMKFDSVINIQLPQDDRIHNNPVNYLIIILILVATFFSFLYLDTQSFWLDEACSISFVNLSWSQLWEIISRREANMSLYYVLLKIWVAAFGDSEFAARSLSVIFAVGGVIMTYAIGARLFNVRTGLTAGLVLTVNAFFIKYAQEARGYTLLLLLTTFSMYLFIKVIERQQYRYYIALGLTNALVLYAHFFGFFVLIAQIISLVFLPPRTIRWKRMLMCAILTASLAVPLGIFILTQESHQLGWISKPSLLSVVYVFMRFTGEGGSLLLLSYFIPCFVSFVFAVQAFIRFKKSNLVWRYALLLCWLFVPILSLYLVSMFNPLFVDRYMISSLPALVLLTGVGLSSFRSKALYTVATSFLIILSLHTVFYVYYPEKKAEWRSATRIIIQNAKEGDSILFYSRVAEIPFEYYYRKMNGRNEILVSVYPFPLGSSFRVKMSTKVLKNPSESMLESLSERYDRLWVVLAHDMIEGLGWDSRPIIRAIERKYINRENFSFTGIKIKLYERYSDHGKQ